MTSFSLNRENEEKTLLVSTSHTVDHGVSSEPLLMDSIDGATRAIVAERNESADGDQATPRELQDKLSSASTSVKYTTGVAMCLLSHVLFGLQHPFSRYLQHDVSHPIPTLSLLFTSNLVALLLYMPVLLIPWFKSLWTRFRNRNEPKAPIQEESNLSQVIVDEGEAAVAAEETQTLLEPTAKRSLKQRLSGLKKYIALIVFIVAIILRSGTNLYSTKFTTAVNVQLVSLSTPFVVSLLSFCLGNRLIEESQREAWNWKGVAAMIITVLGGALIVVGGSVHLFPKRHWYDFLFQVYIDWVQLFKGHLTWRDGLGMSLAFFSTVSLSIYMIALRFMKKSQDGQPGITISENSLFLIQQLTVVCVFFIPSITLEDWSAWRYLDAKGYCFFMAFSILVYLVGRSLNIYSIQILGAATSGSMLAVRLVATIIFSEMILSERLRSTWQLVGSIVVIIAVSYFIYNQNKERKRRLRIMERRKKRQLAAMINRSRESMPATVVSSVATQS